jgi:hypothetical protein
MRNNNFKFFTLIIAAAVIGHGCAAPEIGVIVQGLSDPDSSCVYTPSTGTGTVYRAEGYLDLKFLESSVYQMKYIAGVNVNNYLQNSIPTTTQSGSIIPPLYVNGSDVFPSKAHVKVRKPNEQQTDASFGTYQWVVEMSGSPIQASTSPTSPTSGIVLFELMPYNVIANIIANDPSAPASPGDGDVRIAVDFSIQFLSGGGNILYSNTYTYMINLCYGCLAPTSNFSMVKMQCTDGYAIAGNLCSPGQDAAIACVAVQ